MKNSPVSMIAVLACVCIIVSAILGFANFITKDKIAEIAFEKVQKAMLELLPDSTFEEVETENSSIETMYAAKADDGTLKGVCLQVTVMGSVADITLIVGVNADASVSGVKITAINETAGLGSKANDPNWLSQFNGLSGHLNIAKNKKESLTDIVAISGATITSEAIVNGVNIALDCAKDYLGGLNK